jgi:hypothetical protein
MTNLGISRDDANKLVGKTITAATPNTEDRTDSLALTFSDGTKAEINYWAAFADDGTLELEVTEP